MAPINQQQTSILQLAQAMFNAAPGATYLNVLSSQMTAGQSLADLAQSLSGNVIFFGKNYSASLTAAQFANAFVDDLVGNRASTADKAWAIDYIVNRMAAGATQADLIAELTQTLSSVPASNPSWGEAALYYNTGNATKIVDNLVGDSVTADSKAFAVDYIVDQMAAGQTFGAMIAWAITALDGIDHADPVWGNAAALFDNRIEVSRYYSVERAGAATDLAILQNILTGVTADVATIAAAKAVIDILTFNSVINLSSLDGSTGFRLDGVAAYDWSGRSVSSAGDVNGDGFDDVIVGALGAKPNGVPSGSSYVVFGKASGFSATLDLSSLDGNTGFRLDGATYDGSGRSISSAGDVNGDGFDDVIVGAPPGIERIIVEENSPLPNIGFIGASYVVFGKASGFSATLDLSSLDGNTGFRLDGVAAYDGSGLSVSSAGDVNGDGLDDVIVGAPGAYNHGYSPSSSYVVFGKASGFSATLDLSSLDGNTGFRLVGAAYDRSGFSVSSAGDVNGDGFDDLIIGAYKAGPDNGYSIHSGSSYVVFGNASGFSATLDLSSLDGNTGFRMDGVAGDGAGRSVSSAGDVNGDGFDDVIVGTDPTDNSSGSSYVVFGSASGFGATLDLSSLDGNTGFRMDGAAGDEAGSSVSSAGDVNGDGFDDVMVGASGAEPNGSYSGTSYVVFGKASGFSATLALSSLNVNTGFRLDGVAAQDYSGLSVSSAGDVNGDGFDDLMVGAPWADPNGDLSGSSYVVFGGNFTAAVTYMGTSGDDSLNAGTTAAERFVAGDGNDTMTGGGGADVFHGGAGNDTITVSGLGFQLVDGGAGSDTLALAGSGLNLNLASVRSEISDIETINLTGSGNNTLTLTALDLLNLSDTSNILKADGNAGDSIVGLSSGWTDGGINGDYHTYTQDAAVLLVGVNVTTDFV